MPLLPKSTDKAGIEQFYARRFADLALRSIKRVTGSRTLRAALRVEREFGRTFVGVPHYWAVYYHDGRGVVRPSGVRAKWLIWYPNPKDDPRHRGKYPVRSSDITLLSGLVEWEDVMADVEAGIAVMARYSGTSPIAGVGQPFFQRGLRRFFQTQVPRGANVRAFKAILRGDIPELFRKTTRKIKVFV